VSKNSKTIKFSMFTVNYPINEKLTMLYNTLTSAGGVIETPIFNKIKNGFTNGVDSKIIDTLIHNGFIVNGYENEVASYWCFYQRIKYHSVYDEFHIAFLPTYKCNFKCVYCFEDRKSLETVANKKDEIRVYELINWIDGYQQKFNFKKLGIVFYGGEPLVNKRKLIECIAGIKSWSEKKNINFHFSVVTNGSLLEKNAIDFMIRNGLKEIQITLDGDKDIHNQRRPFKNGSGSFDCIFKNLEICINKGVDVSLRMNIDRHNASKIGIFLNKLKGMYHKKNLRLAPGLVDPSPFNIIWNKKYVPQSFQDRIKFMKEAKIGIFSNIEDPNVLLKEHKLQFGLCHAKIDNYFIIGPEGNIYTCYSFIGYKDAFCGNIREGVNSKFSEFLYSNDEKVRKCLEEGCPFTPICNGGCIYQSYLEYRDISKRVCQREYFQKIWLPFRAKAYYRIIKDKGNAVTGRKS